MRAPGTGGQTMYAPNETSSRIERLLGWKYDLILTERERQFLVKLHQVEEVTTKEQKALRDLEAKLTRLAKTRLVG